MPKADSGGLQIDFADLGQGEPAVLLLPGWCSTRESYRAMMETGARQRRMLALDWRGHGLSDAPLRDFGGKELLDDALAVIEASGAETVVPVALAHSGWVAIELRRRLGARVPGLVLIDWIVLDPPQPFLAALHALQDPKRWRQARDQLFAAWLHGVDSPAVSEFVLNVMGAFEFEMWARAGKDIAASYERFGNPLAALKALSPPAPTLHIYAQPPDPAYFEAQQTFAAANPWFRVRRIGAHSHFPMLEKGDQIAGIVEGFVARVPIETVAGLNRVG
jgi:pimeloyl-ACP methyl ester carboxylesterase